MKQKRVFRFILVILAILLALLPFVVGISEMLTSLVENIGIYRWIQQAVVPWGVGIVGEVVKLLGIDFVAAPGGFRANGIYARLTWNCIGWQSLLFFILSLPVGFSGGNYAIRSKIEAVVIGLLGTFLVNIFRMSFIVILLAFSPKVFAVVFHDYLAAIVSIGWLVLFWWFCYAYILEERIDLETKGLKEG